MMSTQRTPVWESFEKFQHSLSLRKKMGVSIFKWLVAIELFFLMIYFMAVKISFDDFELHQAYAYLRFITLGQVLNELLINVWDDNGFSLTYKAFEISQNAQLKEYLFYFFKIILDFSIYFFLVSQIILILIPIVAWIIWLKKGHQKNIEKLRGADLVSEKELQSLTKKDKGFIPIAQFKIPKSNQKGHTFIVGSSGGGKSTLLYNLLRSLRKQGKKAIIHDFKGDLISKFYDPKKDYIYNPFDQRDLGWRMFNEIENITSFDFLSENIIPDPTTGDSYFEGAARDILYSVLIAAHQLGKISNYEVYELINLPLKKLIKLLERCEGTERGIKQLTSGKSATTDSVLKVLYRNVSFFYYLGKADGNFSCKNWLQNKNDSFLFLGNQEAYSSSIAPCLKLFLDVLTQKLLSLEESSTREIYFILDEVTELKALNNLDRITSVIRSKGGFSFICTQGFSNLDEIYGENKRNIIIGNCDNFITFSTNSPKDSEIAAKKLGEVDVKETSRSFSLGVENYRDGVNLKPERDTRYLVTSTEIQELKKGQCYVKFKGYPSALSSTTKFKPKDINPVFLENKIVTQIPGKPKETNKSQKESASKANTSEVKGGTLEKNSLEESISEDLKEEHHHEEAESIDEMVGSSKPNEVKALQFPKF